MNSKPQFIAEVDTAGNVLWVWHKPAGTRKCHHIKDFVGARRQIEEASCHGASCTSIRAWIENRALASTLTHKHGKR